MLYAQLPERLIYTLTNIEQPSGGGSYHFIKENQMRLKMKFLLPFFCLALGLSSCESEAEIKQRIASEEQQRIGIEEQRKADEKEKAIYDKYISNSLRAGSTPYSQYYGRNSYCDDYGCSDIKVRTSNSDVLVTIKSLGDVVSHAYINSGSSYSFSVPQGTYQIFFYYGKGWNPEKEMKGGEMKGGFITNESFGKDDPQYLSNNILEYDLISQENGNFSTRPSNPDEAL